ncbi:MAG: hypothetical protein ABI210_13320 [Abditibacteriaceae bacterium]
MKKIYVVLSWFVVAGIAFSLTIAHAQIKVLHQYPLRIVPLYPKPKVTSTPWTVFTNVSVDVPIIIIVNKSGRNFPFFSQVDIFVDDNLGDMSHAKATLPNGEQRVIIPYIRKGGTVRVETGGKSWYSKEQLQCGIPMIVTFLPHNKVTVNKPYHGD